jgi:hypothetical protein
MPLTESVYVIHYVTTHSPSRMGWVFFNDIRKTISCGCSQRLQVYSKHIFIVPLITTRSVVTTSNV